MERPLPDVSGLARIADHEWRELGDRLREIRFDSAFVRGLWPPGFRVYHRLQTAARIWRARQLQHAAAYAYRALVLRDPLEAGEADAAFGAHLVGRLITAGFLHEPAPEMVVSRFDCRFFMGLPILCDDVSYEGDAVFGTGPGNAAFAGLSSRQLQASRALDVGCGAGAVALWIANHAGEVVASDINPRAQHFVRINAAINNLHNVETRVGDLFEPVGGERFDLIVSQPPFVPTPPAARPARYRNGGSLGDDIARRLFAAIPHHLTDEGRAVVVFERAVVDDDTAGRAAMSNAMPNLRVLLLCGAEVGADEYSVRHASQDLHRGVGCFDEAFGEMREHLARTHIRAVRPSIAVIGSAAESDAWIETFDTSGTLWDELSEDTLDRLFEAHALVHEPFERLKQARPRVPDGSPVLHGDDGNGGGIVYVALPRGHLMSSLQLSELEWERVCEWQSGVNAGVDMELAVKVARAGLLDV